MADFDKIRSDLEEVLRNKPYILRTDKQRQELDGISAGGMANLDTVGQGPSESIFVGRHRAYVKGSYIDWLMGRITRECQRAA